MPKRRNRVAALAIAAGRRSRILRIGDASQSSRRCQGASAKRPARRPRQPAPTRRGSRQRTTSTRHQRPSRCRPLRVSRGDSVLETSRLRFCGQTEFPPRWYRGTRGTRRRNPLGREMVRRRSGRPNGPRSRSSERVRPVVKCRAGRALAAGLRRDDLRPGQPVVVSTRDLQSLLLGY